MAYDNDGLIHEGQCGSIQFEEGDRVWVASLYTKRYEGGTQFTIHGPMQVTAHIMTGEPHNKLHVLFDGPDIIGRSHAFVDPNNVFLTKKEAAVRQAELLRGMATWIEGLPVEE